MKTISLEEFGDRLVELLPRLMQEINRHESHYITEGTVTCSQLTVMEYLTRHETCQMGELAEAMGISFSAATGMLDRLVQHKFVKRFRSADDRRAVLVSMTSRGRKVVEEIYEQKRKGLVDLFARLASEERATYLEILEKLVLNLAQAQAKIT